MSIVIRGKRFASLNDPVFVGNRRIRKIMVGIEQVYPIPTQYFALYAQWILFPEMVSGYGPHPVDQYGAMLIKARKTSTMCRETMRHWSLRKSGKQHNMS